MSWARVCRRMCPGVHGARTGKSLQAGVQGAALPLPPQGGEIGVRPGIPRTPLRARFFPHSKI